jgi:hypothetical protein
VDPSESIGFQYPQTINNERITRIKNMFIKLAENKQKILQGNFDLPAFHRLRKGYPEI